MAQAHHIRKLYFEEGASISEISRRTGHDRKTIRHYLEKEDFSQEIPILKSDKPQFPSLAPYKETIDKWLLDDKKARKKQRHTAQRIHNRLIEVFPDQFNLSYRTVAGYVAMRKAEIYRDFAGSFIPLRHIPGEAQVDFGEADFYQRGNLYRGKTLNMAFPHSNQGYLQVFRGENQQCLFEGLIAIFHHLGGVPTRLWFDNTSTIVTKILKGGKRNLTHDFLRFMEHYRFEVTFCNPESGHEKGSVEAKVGYHRRNLLVPVPRFDDINLFNQELLERCDHDGKREHYRKDGRIDELHDADRKALLELPRMAFDPSKYITVRTNAYGKFTLNKNLHEYSVSPEYANRQVLVKITSKHVAVMDDSRRVFITHERLYGSNRQSSMDWLPYLSKISRHPAAIKYSGIYEMFPETLRNYLDDLSKSEKGSILRIISALTEKDSFEAAIKTVESALEHRAYDPDSLSALHTRLHHDSPELSPLMINQHIPKLSPAVIQLESYDAGLRVEGGERKC